MAKKYVWKEQPILQYGAGPTSLKKHYKSGSKHCYIYGRSQNELQLVCGTIVRGKFKKTRSKYVKDTYENYRAMIKPFQKKVK
jgi:hypothetical protein